MCCKGCRYPASAWEAQHPDRKARGVGQSAVIGKQIGAKVNGWRHVDRISKNDVGAQPHASANNPRSWVTRSGQLISASMA
jgi:hypothetical protein